MIELEYFARIMTSCQWICGPGNVFCRHVFTVEKKIAWARLLILADPHSYAKDRWMQHVEGNLLLGGSFIKYRLFVNGLRIGAGPFRSIVDGKPVLHCFDLTKIICPGKNVLGVISRGERKGFALVMEVKFVDGSQRITVSGKDFQVLNVNDIYRPVCWEQPNIDQFFKGCAGPGEYPEHIDGEKYPFGWLQSEYDDSGWMEAKFFGSVDEPFEIADDQNYELTTMHPDSVGRTGSDSFLVDFGREMVAGLELDAPAGGGSVEIRLGEELLNESHVRFQMRTDNCYQELWKFPANGGLSLAHFGVRAFRYAEIVDYRGELTKNNIRAITLNRPFNWNDSKFDCPNLDLTKVWSFCKNSIAWTNTDVYNDCPSRERTAYEADGYITMLSHFAVEGSLGIARRTVEYQINHPTWPCEWRQFMIPLFYEYLMYTGDLDLVKIHYETLRNKYSFHNLLKNGLVDKFPLDIIIDWPEKYRDGYVIGSDCAVPNAFAYWDLILLAKLADFMGRSGEATEFEHLAYEVKAAFNNRLFNNHKQLYRDNSVTDNCSFHANMFALCFDLVPDERIANCLRFIMDKGMVCSVYGAQFYLETLFKYGQAEFAIKLMTATNNTSWLGMMNLGATICTEVWNSVDKRNGSMAHPWASAPANIISRCLFGLRPVEPGWKEFSFEPQPGGLEYGKLTIPTPHGQISAMFRLVDGAYERTLS